MIYSCAVRRTGVYSEKRAAHVLIRREEPCHVKDIFRKEMYWQILYTIIR